MHRHPDRQFSTNCDQNSLELIADRLARFSAWYEMFPRSCVSEPGRHGTFKDCEAQLPRIAEMGFDVLYFPPIHPIGRSFRKGKNNNRRCAAGRTGQPLGHRRGEGGHKAVHPELGTLEDFRRLIARANTALKSRWTSRLQCSPDHPYVTRASRMVSPPARRLDSICRKSAKKIPGHLPV